MGGAFSLISLFSSFQNIFRSNIEIMCRKFLSNINCLNKRIDRILWQLSSVTWRLAILPHCNTHHLQERKDLIGECYITHHVVQTWSKTNSRLSNHKYTEIHFPNSVTITATWLASLLHITRANLTCLICIILAKVKALISFNEIPSQTRFHRQTLL